MAPAVLGAAHHQRLIEMTGKRTTVDSASNAQSNALRFQATSVRLDFFWDLIVEDIYIDSLKTIQDLKDALVTFLDKSPTSQCGSEDIPCAGVARCKKRSKEDIHWKCY